jgi:DNA-3-methyladenine glycosylase
LNPLPLSFYQRDTKKVALDLLGQRLVRIYKGQRLSGIITEVEAYLGVKDKAAHSFGNKRTLRTETMYLPGGYAYIYLIYGMYHCFNITTMHEGVPEAILIRALEPCEGISQMQKLRGKKEIHELTTGPGKLSRALKIDSSLNKIPLDSDVLFVEKMPSIKKSQIIKTPRIGVDYAEAHALWPLRYYIRGNKFISRI